MEFDRNIEIIQLYWDKMPYKYMKRIAFRYSNVKRLNLSGFSLCIIY